MSKNNICIGLKAAMRAIKEGRASKLLVAADAKEQLTRPIIELAEAQSIETEYIETMKALGRFCQIDVGAAAAVIIKQQKIQQ